MLDAHQPKHPLYDGLRACAVGPPFLGVTTFRFHGDLWRKRLHFQSRLRTLCRAGPFGNINPHRHRHSI